MGGSIILITKTVCVCLCMCVGIFIELHITVQPGPDTQVEQVVERGDLAALNQADKYGQTPLHLACYKVHPFSHYKPLTIPDTKDIQIGRREK